MSDPEHPTHESRPAVVCAADIGKTRCRVTVVAVEGTTVRVLAQVDVDGVPGLATAPDETGRRFFEAVRGLDAGLLAQVEAYGLGAAGARLAPTEATALAVEVQTALRRPAIVASDVLVAHLGALGGSAGSVAIAGTGAVAYHVATDGRIAMADGWGPVIGDLGGGFWFGMRGLQDALAGDDGRGPATSLTERARAWAPDGRLVRLPSLVAGAGFARRVAGFARPVLEEAERGDSVAVALRAEGVRHLGTSLAAVASPDLPVAVVGGLADNPAYARAMAEELTARRLAWRPALGTGLTGAALLAAYALEPGGRLPHEPHLHRGTSTPG